MKTCKKEYKFDSYKFTGYRSKCYCSLIFFVMLLVSGISGCEQTKSPVDLTIENSGQVNKTAVYLEYAPVKIDILPLTEFATDEDTQQEVINIFVSIQDSFGSQIKSPCIFRFELYQRVPLSADAKGDRIVIWPDIDLIDPETNNEYWRNYLRAYEFKLTFEPQNIQPYLLEVTCLCPNNKRISEEFTIQTKG